MTQILCPRLSNGRAVHAQGALLRQRGFCGHQRALLRAQPRLRARGRAPLLFHCGRQRHSLRLPAPYLRGTLYAVASRSLLASTLHSSTLKEV